MQTMQSSYSTDELTDEQLDQVAGGVPMALGGPLWLLGTLADEDTWLRWVLAVVPGD
jgi:hypothetical protein